MVLLALAGLQSQGEDLLEAARVDGAGTWSIFRSLTLPQLRPYIARAGSPAAARRSLHCDEPADRGLDAALVPA
jgi:ABC-type nitrate/sulfonate/bicarbonate transport system permease component